MEEEHLDVAGENLALNPSTFSAEIVASNIDLLTEILLRLPVRSLIVSKLVSKEWNSMITNPTFPPLFYNRNPNRLPSGIFFPKSSLRDKNNVDYHFVSLDVDKPVKKPPFVLYPPKPKPKGPPYWIQKKKTNPLLDQPAECPFMTKLGLDPPKGDIEILQSSNGLLLFKCNWNPPGPYPLNPYEYYKYFVYNPTTNNFASIDSLKRPHRITLVFDPKKSPYFTLVCLLIRNVTCWLEIYSSETRTWKASGKVIASPAMFWSKNGVYWNDALHWVDLGLDFFYLKLDDESLHVTRIPHQPGVHAGERDSYCLVESSDCLVYTEHRYPQLETFIVYEMRRDYSGWNVKYRVDLSQLGWWEWGFQFQCVIHAVVLGEREEDSFMVIQVPRKVMRYNLASGTSEKMCDSVQDESCYEELRYFSCGTSPMSGFLFIPSLLPVVNGT